MSIRHFLVAMTLALAGCTATGPTFTPVDHNPAGEATVYIYRGDGFGLGGRSAYFYVNDVNVFDLDRLGYSWIALPPGHYRLRQSWPIDVMARSTQVEIDVKAGEARYFSFDTGGCSGRCISYALQEESPSAGRAAIMSKHFQTNFGSKKLHERLSGR